MSTAIRHVGVIGAGAWGTALAAVACRAGRQVTIWARSPELADTINADHCNTTYLPGIPLPDTLMATARPEDLSGIDLVLLATPAQAMRDILARFSGHLSAGITAVINSKGIENTSGQFLSDVLADIAPDLAPACLSGPSFAADVTRGLPTAVALAANDMARARQAAEALSFERFRIYPGTDLKGVQLCGTVKNVLAIACGICEGKKLGDSARSALVTRGFAELSRLAARLDVASSTLTGLAGLGDLILTCTSRQSRNYSLGVALGEGETLAAIMAGRRTVWEGVHSVSTVVDLATRNGIEMPIAEAVNAIVQGSSTADREIARLLARPIGSE
jgi:glycerol-3-phosphate dehydrogenase (NAD(P)+)